MEEIFLDDDIDNNNNNNNSETIYHRIIRDSFAQVTRLNKRQTDWNIVLDDNHVKVFKHHKENFFKGEMISTAHMHHLTRLFSDVHMVTRRQWDKDTLKDLVPHESYPTEKTMKLCIILNIALIIAILWAFSGLGYCRIIVYHF